MATVHETLRASGFTEEQIAAMDAKAIAVFDGVLSTSEAERKAAAESSAKAEAERKAAQEALDRAELEKRSNVDFYETKIVPSLTSWEEERNQLRTQLVNSQSEAAYYKTQNESARGNGFVPADAPKFEVPANQNRDDKGRYQAGGNEVPGSPSFMKPEEFAARAGDAAGILTDIQWKYQSLYGQTLPIAPSQLIREADAQKLSPADYAARKFNFSQREQEIAAQRQRDHEAKIAQEASTKTQAEYEAKMKAQADEFAAKEKQMAERVGNNPDLRVPDGAAKFAEVRKAMEKGDRPNPLKMTDAERRAATRRQIHEDISQSSAVA